jgi:hypothetical protein
MSIYVCTVFLQKHFLPHELFSHLFFTSASGRRHLRSARSKPQQTHTNNSAQTSGGEEDPTHPVLVDDIYDDNEAAVVLAVVDQGHPPNLHEPLERLCSHHNNINKARIISPHLVEQEKTKGKRTRRGMGWREITLPFQRRSARARRRRGGETVCQGAASRKFRRHRSI